MSMRGPPQATTTNDPLRPDPPPGRRFRNILRNQDVSGADLYGSTVRALD